MSQCVYCEIKVDDTYCILCGNKPPEDGEERVITNYFRKGFLYGVILEYLKRIHDINISLRTLKYKLKCYGLKRKTSSSANLFQRIDSAILKEIQGPGSMSGYRAIWHTLRLKYGIFVPRNMVMNRLREIDPVGTAERTAHRLRRRKYTSLGPNDCWHMDGYDKLKPFGFPIHGCIDGFSRKLIWLNFVPSNNDPFVIARLYLNQVINLGGCPKRVRSDRGSENIVVAAIQCFFRRHGSGPFSSLDAHIYGTSTGNQHQEAWWSFYRRSRSTWIINFFKDMVEAGELDTSDDLQKVCLRHCFGPLLQKDLDIVKTHWNTHYIRKSHCETQAGRPDELYCLADMFNKENQLCLCDEKDIEEMVEYVDNVNEADPSSELKIANEYFDYLHDNLGIGRIGEWLDAKKAFARLMSYARQ